MNSGRVVPHDGHAPRFTKRFAEVRRAMVDGLQAYADEVRTGRFPGPEHTYSIRYDAPGSPAVARRILELLQAAGMPARVVVSIPKTDVVKAEWN